MSLLKKEWPDIIVDHLSEGIFDTAFEVRTVTGCPVVPSPVPGAHVRFSEYNENVPGKGSRHNVGLNGETRKADGTDLFLVRNSDARRFWKAAQQVESLGGFGIYFDTKLAGEPRVMFHLDRRPNRLLWVCPNTAHREYVYQPNGPLHFDAVLDREFARLEN